MLLLKSICSPRVEDYAHVAEVNNFKTASQKCNCFLFIYFHTIMARSPDSKYLNHQSFNIAIPIKPYLSFSADWALGVCTESKLLCETVRGREEFRVKKPKGAGELACAEGLKVPCQSGSEQEHKALLPTSRPQTCVA